ncbi:hypothetical protein H6794_00415 [Candidatus Nomurabacteria bacterium]|nr:hypothetical protein [Candidatus Saccharibacteria bacterium]MCA9350427.1 hypothetical protein [Candidatus Saccharibacteria bacterium]MCB9839305.1 hypothetical protein [Candidatus Nomurabacteria bacterium]
MTHKKQQNFIKNLRVGLLFVLALIFVLVLSGFAKAVVNPQEDGVGVEGKISAPPPTAAPTISSPANSRTITESPVTVTGICQTNLLVKLFKNNVFAGSALCQNGSYSIVADLFSGSNELVVRAYDDLDQSSPDSNVVVVTFADGNRPDTLARITMTTIFAKRGADPGKDLAWPISISGGSAPYAVSVDWGDGSLADVYSVAFPGEFIIKHKYEQSGIYRVLVKASDVNGAVGYLQITAIANGTPGQDVAGAEDKNATTKVRILWQPMLVFIPLLITTFWLGKRYELLRIKKRFMKGEDPF